MKNIQYRKGFVFTSSIMLIVLVFITIGPLNISAMSDENPVMVKDINHDGIGSDLSLLTAFGNKLFFQKLWRKRWWIYVFCDWIE